MGRELKSLAGDILKILKENGFNISQYSEIAKKQEQKRIKQVERLKSYKKDKDLTPAELAERQERRRVRAEKKAERERQQQLELERLEQYKTALQESESVASLEFLINTAQSIQQSAELAQIAEFKKQENAVFSLINFAEELAPGITKQELKTQNNARNRLKRNTQKEIIKTALNSVTDIVKLKGKIKEQEKKAKRKTYWHKYYMRHRKRLKTKHLKYYYLKKEQERLKNEKANTTRTKRSI